MAIERKAMFWVGALALACLFLWVFRQVLPPFVAGMALAYFLDPVADRLERLGVSRLVATFAILGLFLVIFVVIVIAIIPTLVVQTSQFIERLPALIGTLEDFVNTNPAARWLASLLPMSANGDVETSISELMRQGTRWSSQILQSVMSGGQALIGVVSFMLISPIVAFYLLWDWDNIVTRVDSWLPRDHVDTIRRLAMQIDQALSGFVRGQVTVALILGTFYAIALTLLGLNFGLLIGIIAGVLNIIPFIGSVAGFIVAVGVALFQFWPDWLWILAIAAVFVAGQVAEGNFLQPVLVGDKVGLHPVWLMFSIIAFSFLFGIAGTLIAVPVAAAVGVVVRFGLTRYLDSPLYHGTGGRVAALPPREPGER